MNLYSLHSDCLKLQIADYAPQRQIDRVLRKAPPSPDFSASCGEVSNILIDKLGDAAVLLLDFHDQPILLHELHDRSADEIGCHDQED
jgi:hypothetical protein